MRTIWRNLILKVQPPRVVTVIGGGGKTSLMYYLVRELKAAGYPAVAATTTKLSKQQQSDHEFVTMTSVEAGYQAVQEARGIQGHITLVFGEDPKSQSKMLGIPGEWLDQLAMLCRDVIFVVEGDGSAGKSLKGHLEHEPVIPRSSSLVIPVIGIDSVGVPLNLKSVHRPERICALTGALSNSLITTEMITKLLFHPQGYLRNCPEQTMVVPFINKVESVVQQRQAGELARQLLASEHPQVGGVIVGSLLKEEGLWLQV